MKAKEYLSQAIWLDKVINNKIEQQESIRALAEKVTVNFTQEKVSGGKGITSPMEEATIKLIDLSHEINDDIDRLIDLKKEILNVINEIDDFRYKLLLEMRYINCKDWDEVANTLGYDTRYILKLHGRALKEIDEILKEDTKRHRKTPGECDIL